MRYLFGTWKGVFPPPTLQVIEKELGSAPMINGSSSGTTTSRPDLLSQRPPHSIHVNPKYLERQRLQQSSRAKGMVNDMTGTLANSKEDYERPDRAAITAGWPYGDLSVKMNKIRYYHRDAFNYAICDKNIGVTFGTYDSDLSQTKGVGVGRTSVTEVISSQRNGFNIKHGSQNYPASKSGNADPRLLARQNISGRSSNATHSNWKNCEEEEFMWEMHSRLSQHDAVNISNNSRKDHWNLDPSEKLDFESPFRKAQSIHDVGSMFDRETSSDSLFAEQKEKLHMGARSHLHGHCWSHIKQMDCLLLVPAIMKAILPLLAGCLLLQVLLWPGLKSEPKQLPLFSFTTTKTRPCAGLIFWSDSEAASVADLPATTTNSSQGKVEQLPPSSVVNNAPLRTSDPESKASIPVSNLLSSLIAKGLISASRDALFVPSPQIPTQIQKRPEKERPSESLNKSLEIYTNSPSAASSIHSSSDAPRPSTMDLISFVEPAIKSSVASHQSASVEVENLTRLEFRPDSAAIIKGC
ncbi:hypothetical protein F3Y22_tig00116982pilonHSYRG00123 [Hibiscus syriacus]|uniref:Uncharacterized protein n=1 Tax=Hibiscus syriacus TaxID=106335 RepID=A0A6A2WSX3_HIBSY|nr:hypothetical protein F3Y22_tig00116982pilonHSYRG00123 [Hibiscus syriacus]